MEGQTVSFTPCPGMSILCNAVWPPTSLARSPSLALLDLISLGWKVSSKWPSTAPFKAFVASPPPPLTRLHFPDDASLGTSDAAQVSLSSISHSPEPESSPCGCGAVVERTPSVTKVVSSILAQSERDFVGGRERTL